MVQDLPKKVGDSVDYWLVFPPDIFGPTSKIQSPDQLCQESQLTAVYYNMNLNLCR